MTSPDDNVFPILARTSPIPFETLPSSGTNSTQTEPQTPHDEKGGTFVTLGRRQTRPPCLQPPTLRRSSARDVILEAVEFLEKENEQLRSHNQKLNSEVETVREENVTLRKDLAELRSNQEDLKARVRKAEKLAKETMAEFHMQEQEFDEAMRERDTERETLRGQCNKRTKELENARLELRNKTAEIQKLTHEHANLTAKLHTRTAAAAYDRKLELLHEIELLKEEREGITTHKDELIRVNEKLQVELSDLQAKLDTSANELKNENRRHGLLTKEFNSLLEENARLKNQLRRRQCSQDGFEDSLKQSVSAIPMENKETIPVLSRLQVTSSIPRLHKRRLSIPSELMRAKTGTDSDKRAARESWNTDGESLPALLTPRAVRTTSWKSWTLTESKD